MKRSRAKVMSRKKLIMAASAVGVVGLLGGYIILSMNQWQGVRFNADRSMSELRQDVALVFADTTNSRERYIAIERLADTRFRDSCSVGWWGDWQSNVSPDARSIKEVCEGVHVQRDKVRQQAQETVQFLDDQTIIQTILVKLSLGEKATITEDDFVKHAKAAGLVGEELDEVAEHDVSQPLLAKAKKAVNVIAESWNRLQKADKAEDQTRYETAVEELDQAYHGLDAVSKEAASSYATLLAELQKSLP